MKRRRAVSLVEVLVSAAIGVIVLTAVMMFWGGSLRAGHAAQSSVTATALALMELSLREDVVQMGPDPACPAQDFCRVFATAVAFDKVSFEHPDRISVHAVVYAAVRSRGGNLLLERLEGPRRETLSDVVLASIQFSVLQASAYHCLRVSGLLLDDDTPPGPSLRTLPFTFLLRLPEPVDRCNPALAATVVYEDHGPSLLSLSLP